jgi:hypothetical protein
MHRRKARGPCALTGASAPVIQVTFRSMLPDEAAVRVALACQMRLRFLAGAKCRLATVALSPGECGDRYDAELRFSRGKTTTTLRSIGSSPSNAVERVYALLGLGAFKQTETLVASLPQPSREAAPVGTFRTMRALDATHRSNETTAS